MARRWRKKRIKLRAALRKKGRLTAWQYDPGLASFHRTQSITYKMLGEGKKKREVLRHVALSGTYGMRRK